MELNDEVIKYLKLLSKQYPTIADASTEIINLEAILNLPKGTEHFLADIHGEYQPFVHVLKNGSGTIKRKIEDLFGNTLMDCEKKSLATLVYYPEQKLEIVLNKEKNLLDKFDSLTREGYFNKIGTKEKLYGKSVGDTDIGKDIKNQIDDLKLLLTAYRTGVINEIR